MENGITKKVVGGIRFTLVDPSLFKSYKINKYVCPLNVVIIHPGWDTVYVNRRNVDLTIFDEVVIITSCKNDIIIYDRLAGSLIEVGLVHAIFKNEKDFLKYKLTV